MDDSQAISKVREEHNKLRAIKGALNEALAASADINACAWLDEVRDRFEHFRAHLIYRFALEEIGGFLNEVIHRRPTLTRQVELLKQGHQLMIELAGTTMTSLRSLNGGQESVDQARLLVKIALSDIKYHEDAEDLLMSYVFTQEIGVGD